MDEHIANLINITEAYKSCGGLMSGDVQLLFHGVIKNELNKISELQSKSKPSTTTDDGIPF